MGLEPRSRGRVEVRARHSFFTRVITLKAKDFITVRETAGWPLLLAAAVALIWANWPESDSYRTFWDIRIELDLHIITVNESLKRCVNDFLLPLFFFVIGLEIKHEFTVGRLSSLRHAALPFITAIGGMLIPIAIYLLINAQGGALNGWGVPAATDIAFALAIVTLLGNRIPPGLRILILAFAAVDDIGGVLIIALAFTGPSEFSWPALAAAGIICLAVYLLQLSGLRRGGLYIAAGILLLGAMYLSGVHTTIAGVLLGLLVPARANISRSELSRLMYQYSDELEEIHRKVVDTRERTGGRRQDPAAADKLEDLEEAEEAKLGELEALIEESEEPTGRFSRAVNPWVSYFILPLFALANAGVHISGDMLGRAAGSPIVWGLMAALCLGKPLGIVGFAFTATKLGWANLPEKINWHHIIGMGLLGGIGFTVALFIAQLAFQENRAYEYAQTAVLAASVVSGVAGYVYLRIFSDFKPMSRAETQRRREY